MAKQGTKALSWLMALALLVSVIAPFALRSQSAYALAVPIVTPTSLVVGTQTAYSFTVTTVAIHPIGSVISITVPSTMTLANVTAPGLLANLTVGVCAAGPCPAVAPAAGTALTLTGGTTVQPTTINVTTGTATAAGDEITLVFAAAGALINPSAETANDIFAFASSVEAGVAAGDVVYTGPIGFLPNPRTASAVAQYTAAFTNTSAVALAAGVDTITLTLPAGVVLPATIARSSISAGATATPNPLTADPVINVAARTITVQVPATTPAGAAAPPIAAGAPGVVIIGAGAGVMNPALGGNAGTAGSATGTAGGIQTSQVTSFVANPGRVFYERTLSNSPTNGRRGTAVTSTVAGFTSGSTATLFIDNGVGVGGVAGDGVINGTEVTLGSGVVGADGKATITWSATVPPLASGNNFTIRAIDNSGLPFNWSPLPNSTAVPSRFTVSRSITLSQATGARGTVITLTGNDWILAPLDVLAVGAGHVTIGGVACGVPAAPAITTAALPAGVTCTVPAGAAAGVSTVRVFRTADAIDAPSATATFTVQGSPITLSPASAVPGTPVSVSGLNFTAGAAVAAAGVTIGGAPWGCATCTFPLTIDTSGNFPATTFNVPAATAPGAIQISITDAGGLNGTATLTVPERSITITPATSGRGSIVTVTGAGFSRNGGVTINYAGVGVTGATTDGSGNFTVNVTVPNTAGLNSTNVISAIDNAAGGLTNQNAVIHNVPGTTLTVTPTTAAVGSTIAVSGQGYPQFTSVAALTIGGLNVLPAAGINTDVNGNFTTTVLVPGQNTGQAAVTATSGGAGGTTIITITAAASDVTSQMQPIATILVRVWAYDNASNSWKLYDPAAPKAASTLAAIAKAQAVNIVTNAAGTLTNAGGSYTLKSGNNLYGWLGP